jgi:hypothetical protein
MDNIRKSVNWPVRLGWEVAVALPVVRHTAAEHNCCATGHTGDSTEYCHGRNKEFLTRQEF